MAMQNAVHPKSDGYTKKYQSVFKITIKFIRLLISFIFRLRHIFGEPSESLTNWRSP